MTTFMVLAFVATVLMAAPAPSHAATVLRQQCLVYAADPKNPWALAHGIKTFGPTFVAADGRRAADVIVHDSLIRFSLPDGSTQGPWSLYGYQRFGDDGTPIEPHTNLNTKAMVCEARMPLSTTFQAMWGPVTLKAIVDSIKRGFRHVPTSAEYWHDVGWTLDLFAATEKPHARWQAGDGTLIDLDAVFDDALTELEKETADLAQGLERHLPQVDKRKQGLYAHSCGGLHFVQGVLAWARAPEVRKRWGARVDRQIAIHFYRLESERRQYEAAAQQAEQRAPQFVLPVLVQKVKFYGHFLETAARFRDDLKWVPDDDQARKIGTAKALLDAAVRELEARKTFEQMDTLKTAQKQVYLDLIGDSCHAAHGLQAWP